MLSKQGKPLKSQEEQEKANKLKRQKSASPNNNASPRTDALFQSKGKQNATTVQTAAKKQLPSQHSHS